MARTADGAPPQRDRRARGERRRDGLGGRANVGPRLDVEAVGVGREVRVAVRRGLEGRCRRAREDEAPAAWRFR